jgi:hypothetical protein
LPFCWFAAFAWLPAVGGFRVRAVGFLVAAAIGRLNRPPVRLVGYSTGAKQNGKRDRDRVFRCVGFGGFPKAAARVGSYSNALTAAACNGKPRKVKSRTRATLPGSTVDAAAATAAAWNGSTVNRRSPGSR